MDKKIVYLILLAASLAIVYFAYLNFLQPLIGSGAVVPRPEEESYEIIAEGLDIPWEIAFLPNGDILVTERPGTLKRIGEKGKTTRIEGVEHIGEGGLLGMTLHPNFPENNWIYLYLTTRSDEGLINRVERYSLRENQLSEKKIIIDSIPGAAYHDGGRIQFGPDGLLYITTGDSGSNSLAQDASSLAGKILRLEDDGGVPQRNPFDSPVYSYGHRNPQGLAWDENDQLWSTEHGRSGILSGLDELNLIQRGKNYGWPLIQGDETQAEMVSPVIHSGSDTTWAPAGAAYKDGSIFFCGLRGSALYEAEINLQEKKVDSLNIHFKDVFGRLRAAVLGPDGNLYITTSNTDGRGNPRSGDDKIIRINLDKI
ncbi:MAG: PQQ-dependent sugar dehydrogenase [Candidatus Nealsonbacteria bacterium]|nr:PQQ-dependent sugar dehydrogenase [Candidatus Nealsonbacteria bacterium]